MVGEKYAIDPQQLFAQGSITSCVPQALFFTRLTHLPHSEVAPVPQSEAMMRLLRQSPWVCYDPVTASQQTQTLMQLAKQCQAFLLHAGRDLLEQPHRAEELLRSCW
jgi:hypothetical protein